MSSPNSSTHQDASGEYVPYHQFGVRGGGRFSMSNPKSDVDWKIYRARQVSIRLPPPSVGFMVQGLWFRVQGAGYCPGPCRTRFGVLGVGFGVSIFRGLGVGSKVWSVGFRVWQFKGSSLPDPGDSARRMR